MIKVNYVIQPYFTDLGVQKIKTNEQEPVS